MGAPSSKFTWVTLFSTPVHGKSYLAGIVLLPELALSEFRSMSRCSCGKNDGLASVAEGIGHMIAFVSQKIRALNELGTLENISAAFIQRASWGSPSGTL
jgi:hypothetical protein